MKGKFLLPFFSILALASCSTAYKSGQTPDDVYYSPARFQDEDQERRRDRRDDQRYELSDNRDIRMRIYDPRWRYFDNDFYYSPYHYGFSTGYYYNPFYWSLPVYNPVVVVNPAPRVSTPRMVNLSGYGNGYNNVNSNPVNSKLGTLNNPTYRGYNNSNRNTGSKLGNALDKIFNNSNSSYDTRGSSSPVNRSYTPASGSSSGSSGGARPARSGGKN